MNLVIYQVNLLKEFDYDYRDIKDPKIEKLNLIENFKKKIEVKSKKI